MYSGLLTQEQRSLCRGFSLLELSIVLVVIGLIAGGILVGQSLLRQSEVASVMLDAQKFITSVDSFQKKYSALPGDMPNAVSFWGSAAGGSGDNYTTTCYASGAITSPATCNGNGDGQINSTGTYANESLRVWQHLADASLIQGAFSGVTGIVHTIGTNAPASRVAGGGFGMTYVGTISGGANASYFDGAYGHVIYFGANKTSNFPIAAVLTGAEAQTVDTKYDDGQPALGTVRTWKNGANSLTCATTTSSTTALYDKSTSDKNCSLIMITGF